MLNIRDKQPAFTPTGFTLAELLIALAILGVIATFTIPKVLDNSSGAQSNAMAKEGAGFMSAAFQNLKLDGILSATTSIGDLTPYINYVGLVTNTTVDNYNTLADQPCTGTGVCLRLHNGSLLWYRSNVTFGDTSTTSMLYFMIDPDGVYGGSTSGPSKSTLLHLYYNGRITTGSDTLPNTYYHASGVPIGPVDGSNWANTTPEYFSWSN